MSANKRQQTIEKAERIYKETAADEKRLAEVFLSICAAPFGVKEFNKGRKGERDGAGFGKDVTIF